MPVSQAGRPSQLSPAATIRCSSGRPRSRCKDCREREAWRILSPFQDWVPASSPMSEARHVRAGDVTVHAKTISMTDGAVIQAGTPSTTGAGGNVTIDADSVDISGRSSISSQASEANAGPVTITANELTPGQWFDRNQYLKLHWRPRGGSGAGRRDCEPFERSNDQQQYLRVRAGPATLR